MIEIELVAAADSARWQLDAVGPSRGSGEVIMAVAQQRRPDFAD
jgi:hypothetical protein